jgi:hypothetical protein
VPTAGASEAAGVVVVLAESELHAASVGMSRAAATAAMSREFFISTPSRWA